jgi:glyoxylase-like metal-dependent hydrolase (beta-lactamase superfamily II)
MVAVAKPSPHHRAGRVFEVAPDVACVPLSIVNVYLVGPPYAGDREWVLIDAGLATSHGAIRRAAAERFGPSIRPGAIVLTHGHFDHVGSVQALAEEWDVPVYAHPLELPYLTGKADYPPPDPTVGGGMMARMSPLFPRRGIDLGDRVRPLDPLHRLPGRLMPGWDWIHTPGHAPGHVSLFRDADRTLIAGDAFVTTRQESAIWALTWRPQVWRPPAYFTIDWPAARHSVEQLAALRPNVGATGHGPPMYGEDLRRGLDELVKHFDEMMPSDGRYVRRPAVADERGVVDVPPPVADPRPKVLAGVAVAGVAAALLVGAARRNGA